VNRLRWIKAKNYKDHIIIIIHSTMCVGPKSSCSEEELTYHHGFGNHFESQAFPGALPQGRNNPRIVPLGLYTEQISGTAFTAPRNENRRTWLYRAQPSVSGTSNSFYACGGGTASSLPETFGGADWSKDMRLDPNPMRWGATPLQPNERVNFIQGMHTLLGSGDPTCKSGIGVYVYAFNTDMSGSASDDEDLHMYNSDGGERYFC
jgi:homogentisate 1,2-dioxygenase